MALRLQLLSVLSRLRAPSLIPAVSYYSCRLASRGPSRGWTGHGHVDRNVGPQRDRFNDDMSDEELQLEDVEDKLQDLIDEGRKQQRTVKYHILRRQMTASGAPERKLTWDAIEQIKYLKKEQPEEWTVERLAEGFSVTPDIILRVLRSKFTPSLARKAKQDAKVMVKLGHQALPSGAAGQQDKLKLAGNRAPNTLPFGSAKGALIPVSGKTHLIRDKDTGPPVKSPARLSVLSTQLRDDIHNDAAVTAVTHENSTGYSPSEEDEESWDGHVFTEEELSEFLEMGKPPPVVQLGNDVFDAEGRFLYRI